MEYSVNEIADRNVGIVAKIKKERLKTLAAAKRVTLPTLSGGPTP